jgi:hypothetical protein
MLLVKNTNNGEASPKMSLMKNTNNGDVNILTMSANNGDALR